MGLSQNHLSLHSPSWIQAPPAPVARGAVPQPQDFLWKGTGSSREHHSARAPLEPAANTPLCRVLKHPGHIPPWHSRALPSAPGYLSWLLTSIPGACRSPQLLTSFLILHPPTCDSSEEPAMSCNSTPPAERRALSAFCKG